MLYRAIFPSRVSRAFPRTVSSAFPRTVSYRALLPNVRVTSPQPFAPGGKGRFARVRAARQSADWLRARPLRAPVLSAPVRRRGSLRPLRFARALDCCAICAASLRKLRFLRRICGGGIPRGWRWRVRAFLGRPRLPPRLASGLGRPPHPPDAGHPASAEYRLRGLSSPRRRGWPSGRPRAARPRVRPSPSRPPRY